MSRTDRGAGAHEDATTADGQHPTRDDAGDGTGDGAGIGVRDANHDGAAHVATHDGAHDGTHGGAHRGSSHGRHGEHGGRSGDHHGGHHGHGEHSKTPARRHARLPVLILLLTLVGLGAAFGLGPSDATTTDTAGSGLPEDSQSAKVAKIVDGLPSGAVAPAIVVYSHSDGTPLTGPDRSRIQQTAQDLGKLGLGGRPAKPQFDPKGKLATVAVPLSTELGNEQTSAKITDIRTAASKDLAAPLRAQVTGAPAFTADLSKVFDGADTRLLLVTAAVVAVLLLITYRSPVLWLVPLMVVGAGDRLATVLVGILAPLADVQVDASTGGILSVLVFGAGTNYALLLVSRYRDELHRHEDRFAAMRRALRATAPAVLASGTTVTLSLLTLLAAELTGNRGLGFAGAVGIVTAMFFGLVVLPAALVLPGRWLFWPLVPRAGSPAAADRDGGWARLGRLVARRPSMVAVGGVLVLVALASGVLGVHTGLSQAESFRKTPEAVLGQQTLQSVLPAGAVEPLTVISRAGTGPQVREAAADTQGVANATEADRTAKYASTTVVLEDGAGTEKSDATIERLRNRLAGIDGANALVGGQTAGTYDVAQATARDTRVVVPLVLAIVFTVLVVLLRALVAPVLLVLTVVASYFASLGASWYIFRTVYDFPALDVGVPLLSFLFLVALGVDYNIFLIARTREETVGGHDTRRAVLRALAVTGGVITSAGILLAAVFAVLGVLPLITLTQIGVVVGVGVLLDTLLVRTVLVPALVLLTGRRFWWPGRPEVAHREAHRARG